MAVVTHLRSGSDKTNTPTGSNAGQIGACRGAVGVSCLALSYARAYPGSMSQMAIAGARPQWRLEDKLRRAREFAGLDQSQLADRIGISRATVSNYERGLHAPRRPVLLTWALATGVELDWLVNEEPRPAEPNGVDVRSKGFEPPTF